MIYEEIKGPPMVARAHVQTVRTAQLTLTNGSRTVCPYSGHTFIPDSLLLQWQDGKLTACSLNGRRLRADGAEYIDGRREGWSMMEPRGGGVSDNTPNWVRDLITEHRPRTITATSINGG